MTLVVAVGLAVVGLAAPSSAHHNTITGYVACRTGGGWDVTWRVVNSEQRTETITASSRPSVVPVGTVLGHNEAKIFAEAVTTKPGSAVTLTLSARWSNGVTQTSSGSIPASSFADTCSTKKVSEPTVPVVDDCGPGNAHYGTVPSGPWTSVVNPDGSLTITADQGHVFTTGTTVITLPAPTDTQQPCPVSPPEVLPAEVRVVKAGAKHLDKCGRASDLLKVSKRAGVVYTVNGKVIRQGVWLHARTLKAVNARTPRSYRVTVRAQAADATYLLEGKQVWRMTFSTKRCAKAPEVAPHTGS
jgi:hypothetical protein